VFPIEEFRLNTQEQRFAAGATPHCKLMLALCNTSFRICWYGWQFDSGNGVECRVCHAIVETLPHVREFEARRALEALERHEAEHVARLGAEQVAAAEALYELSLAQHPDPWPGILAQVWGNPFPVELLKL
jgi:hypothetical protein